MKKLTLILVALGIAGVLMAGCSGGGDAGATGGDAKATGGDAKATGGEAEKK